MSIRVDHLESPKTLSFGFAVFIRRNLPTGEGAPRDRGVGESIFTLFLTLFLGFGFQAFLILIIRVTISAQKKGRTSE